MARKGKWWWLMAPFLPKLMAGGYISSEIIFLSQHSFTFSFPSIFTFTYPFPSFLLTKPNKGSYICLHLIRRGGGGLSLQKKYTSVLLLDTNLKTFNLFFQYNSCNYHLFFLRFWCASCTSVFTLLPCWARSTL